MDKIFSVKSCNGCPFKSVEPPVHPLPWCGHPDAPADADEDAPLIPSYDTYGDFFPDASRTPLPDWCPLKKEPITISLKQE